MAYLDNYLKRMIVVFQYENQGKDKVSFHGALALRNEPPFFQVTIWKLQHKMIVPPEVDGSIVGENNSEYASHSELFSPISTCW